MDLGESFSPIANVTTDEDGAYEFLDVPIGHPYVIEFNHGGVNHLQKLEVLSVIQTLDFNLSGTINFRINGIDGTPMEGVEVDLVSIDAFRVSTTQTDSSGSGSFAHLDIDTSYLITFDEAGVPYTEIAEFDSKTSVTVMIDVLETTTNDEDMAVNGHHVFLEKEEGYLSVWEGITFTNAGDKIFNNSWLKISIPSVAEDISVDIMDCCLQNAELGVIVDPMDPIFPNGIFDITLTYKIKLKSKDFIFDKNVDYDTRSLNVFVQDGISNGVESLRGLSFDEKRTYSDISYRLYSGMLIASGSIAGMTLRGIVTVTDLVLGNQLVWAGGFLLVPIVFIALFVTYNKRGGPNKTTKKRGRRPLKENGANIPNFKQMKPQIDEPLAQDSIEDLRAEEEALITILKKIKVDHEKGTLSNEAYKIVSSKYRRRQKKVRAAITSFKVVDEEEDLRAEKIVLESILIKITKDMNRGTITERAHRKLVTKYVEQLDHIEDKLRSYEENGA
jgi:hypothetical protein